MLGSCSGAEPEMGTHPPRWMVLQRDGPQVIKKYSPELESWQESYLACKTTYIHFRDREIIYMFSEVNIPRKEGSSFLIFSKEN